ncbi:MAG: cation:proton antiporter [bacterium]|nr:cation:proton antiporter [bacterium]
MTELWELPLEHPVLIFAVVLGLILVTPLVCARLRLPGVLGLILAGMVIGPHGLGVLQRDATMELLGQVGLLYIMFLAGLEIDLLQFLRRARDSAVFGATTFVLPLLCGLVVGRWVVPLPWMAAILFASMFSSHTLVTYPIVSRLGLQKSRAVVTAIGGTIVTDTAALLVLAVIAAMARGDAGAWFWLQLLLGAAGFVLIMMTIVPRGARWFLRYAAQDDTVEFIFLLTVVFVAACGAALAGLEPIIGAFAAGLALNSLVPENSALMQRTKFAGNALFIPFFLLSVGMLIDVRRMAQDPHTIVVSLAMGVGILLGKWLGGVVAQVWLGYTAAEGMLLFGMSVNQAAATLAAVMVGYQLQLFNDTVVTGAIIMILISCLAGTWVTDRYGRRVAERRIEEEPEEGEAPDRIMVPLANPETADRLMGVALLLRAPGSREPVYPLAIVSESDAAGTQIAAAEAVLAHAVVHAVAARVPVLPVTRVELNVAAGIARAMTDFRAPVAVIGWNGQITSAHRIFGRILDQLLEHTPQELFVCKCEVPVNTLERVVLLIPPLLQRQAGFETALRHVKRLTSQIGARLRVVVSGTNHAAVVRAVDSLAPRVPLSSLVLEGWAEVRQVLAQELSLENDLVVLCSARKGQLAWQPALDRLPRALVREHPRVNLIVVFPAESATAKMREAVVEEPHPGALVREEHVRLVPAGVSLTYAVSTVIEPAFPHRPARVQELAEMLTDLAQREPVELTPGAVLLHAHIPDIAHTTAFLAIVRGGLVVPQVTTPARLVFVMLSPRAQAPEVHLRMLAQLARALRTPGVMERLCAAESAADAAAVLREPS